MRPLVATYRLQLGPTLTFADARALVPYLADLGVSHLYLSPVLQARRGSTHGYDVVDPRRVSDVLGGEDGLRELAGAGLELIVDIVPNHMAASDENPFWADPALRAQFFDLDPHGGHRRFFDIDELAGVRMEDPEVFSVTHAKVLELVRDGAVAGVRVDHVDGLADPAGYLSRLADAGIDHVWVEKILEPGESLPPWPVEGTTGYEFLVDVDALFVDPAGRSALDAAAGARRPFHVVGREQKVQQVATTFRPELERLRRVADLPQLDDALAALPVYRTYLDPVTRAHSEQDARALAALPAPVADALRDAEGTPPELVVRFQQTTGAVMAKGIEDTAMYRDVRLLALDEVGGDPDRFGIDVDAFHRGNEERARRSPRALLAATTHDTKRSADVRARLLALSSMGGEWHELVDWWCTRCGAHRGSGGPDDDEQRFVLQTLVGAWPLSAERLDGYLVKALREAKRNTTWTEPDDDWERAVVDVTHAAIDAPGFTERFLPFLDAVVDRGERIALGELVLRTTSPGAPDLYQGDELWNLLLVDPDNRRPVDWDVRRDVLRRVRDGASVDRGSAKLVATTQLLHLRRRYSGLEAMTYRPLDAPPGICAFTRGTIGGEAAVVVVAPIRPGVPLVDPVALGLPAAPPWRDVLAALERVYGADRPGVFVAAGG